MTYNRIMVAFFATYFLKIPLAIVLYANENYYGLFLTFVLSFVLEIALFIYANTRPFGK